MPTRARSSLPKAPATSKRPSWRGATPTTPALTETNGEYDGRCVYINDRANGRIAMVDLRDFKTKQILDVPNLQSSHGGVFVTQNTEYVHISTKTPTPRQTADGYAALEDFADAYPRLLHLPRDRPGDGPLRRATELPDRAAALHAGPADAGKLASHGWVFINSLQLGDGGRRQRPRASQPLESGASKRDFDYLHIINWKKADEVVAAGKTEDRNGMRVIPLDTAVAEGVLYLAPEPRSPHGVDVAPTASTSSVGGQARPARHGLRLRQDQGGHRRQELRGQATATACRSSSSMRSSPGRSRLASGPLHTQFDDKGNGYISLFLESAVAKWTLGPKPGFTAGEEPSSWSTRSRCNYNIGHLVTIEGDTVAADGQVPGRAEQVVDRPLPGPGYAQAAELPAGRPRPARRCACSPTRRSASASRTTSRSSRRSRPSRPWRSTSRAPTRSRWRTRRSPSAPGKERVERDGTMVHVCMTVKRSHFTPDIVRVKQGDQVILHLTNIEQTADATHGFAIPRLQHQRQPRPG